MTPYDIPMLFSAPFVIANLEGRKTQTRRMPTRILDKAYEAFDEGRPVRLWQRECFSLREYDLSKISEHLDFWYWADGDVPFGDWSKPKPSIHMPRWASRFTGIVSEIRKEPVQNMLMAGALAEGMTCPDRKDDHECLLLIKEFRSVWDSLHANNPKKPGESWANNPTVYVIIYKGVNQNINEVV